MPIVSEKKFLTEKELQDLKKFQNQTQSIIIELGEIEFYKIQLEKRSKNIKESIIQIETLESEFSDYLDEKYGKISLNTETGEITSLK